MKNLSRLILLAAAALAALSLPADITLGGKQFTSGLLNGKALTKVTFGDKLIWPAQVQAPVLLTPAMTSNTTPAPVVLSSSAVFGANEPPWVAFDQKAKATNNAGVCTLKNSQAAWPNATDNVFILVDLGSVRTLNRIVIRSHGTDSNSARECSPTAFTVLTATESAETVALAVAGITGWTSAYQAKSFDIPPCEARTVRICFHDIINMSKTQGFVGIGEIELYGF